MLVCIAYCLRDYEITAQLLDWIGELDSRLHHNILLLHDERVPKDSIASIVHRSKTIFESVDVHVARAKIDGWPEGANYMFRTATAILSHKNLPHFLWLEPDAIPLKPGWLDALEDEYKTCGKPFMGDDVNVEDIPRHMSGVAIYPNPIYNLAGEAYRASDTAWDMTAKDQIIPNAHFTELIEHAWRHPEFTNMEELKTQINPKAVLFHASKDGSLINLLRRQRSEAHAELGGSCVVLPSTGVNEGANPSPLPTILSGGVEKRKPTDASESPDHPTGKRNGIVKVMSEPLGSEDKVSPAQTLFPAAPVLAEPLMHAQERNLHPIGGEARESTIEGTPVVIDSTDSRGGGEPISADIFIRTYPNDYPWLEFCLKSIHKYATGFRKIWIVSPTAAGIPGDMAGVEWKVMNEEAEDGYLSQQIHKLYADVITDYGAEYILHVDSDILFTQPVTPQTFFTRDKLTWYYTPYEAIETPWKSITEKFLKKDVPYEFMRRLPMMIPRFLYPKLREYCHTMHGMILSQYVKNQPYREFSEFNALGAFAWEKYHDKFHWINTLEITPPPPVARQFFSWDGITDRVKIEIQEILTWGDKPKGGDATCPTSLSSNINTDAIPEGSNAAPTSNPNGAAEMSVGDHVRALATYADVPWKRQYVIRELKKANLLPKWKRKKR